MSAVLEPAAAICRTVPLTEAVELNPKADRGSLSDDFEVSFVPMAAVEAGTGGMDATTVRRYAEVKKGYTYFREGDVLFAKITPCMENGKMAVARHLRNGVGFGSTEFHVLRPREGVDPYYVYHFVSSARFRAEAAHHMTGAVGQKRVPAAFLEQSEIALPPIDEQRRIVAEIEKQLSRLNAAVVGLKRTHSKLDRYRASVLTAACNGSLVGIDASRWSCRTLGEVATAIRNGYSGKPDAVQGTRIFRISAVRRLKLDLGDVRYLSGPLSQYEESRVAPGDILFTRYNGSRNLVGVCAVVPQGLPPTIHPDKLIRVRVPDEILAPNMLAVLASAGVGRAHVESRIRTTAGQSGISGSDLKALPLTIPPRDVQEAILFEVARRLSVVDQLGAEIAKGALRATRLRSSIFMNAFRHAD